MKTIQEFKNEYIDSIESDNSLTKMDIIEQNLNAIDASIKFAQRWIPVEEELPLCIESGMWDGLRSEFVLIKHLDGTWNKARLYSGIIDGHKFSDWYSDEDYELCNIIAWRPIELK